MDDQIDPLYIWATLNVECNAESKKIERISGSRISKIKVS